MQSPDLNVTDLGFLVSLECRVWGKRFSFIYDRIEMIRRMFYEYDSEALDWWVDGVE